MTIVGIRPTVWREVSVPSDYSVADLHDVIQLSFGWTNSHLYEFRSGRTRYCPLDPEDEIASTRLTLESAAVPLHDVLRRVGSRLDYEYDFGDSWEHRITVAAIRSSPEENDDPRCVAGARSCPPEDCGGIGGYARFLRAVQDPQDPEHGEWLSWCGGWFDAESFDLDRVNRILSIYAARRRTWHRSPLSANPADPRHRSQRTDLLAGVLRQRDRAIERRRKDSRRRRLGHGGPGDVP
jgi:hypothetical protein